MSSRRILLLGVFLLLLSTIFYSLVYHMFFAREYQTAIAYNFDMAINMAIKGDLTTASAFAQEVNLQSKNMDFISRIPYDLSLTAIIAMIPLWLAPRLEATSETLKKLLALFIICGGFLLAAGDFLQALALEYHGYYFMVVGYIWIALGLIGYFFYAALDVWLQPTSRRKRG